MRVVSGIMAAGVLAVAACSPHNGGAPAESASYSTVTAEQADSAQAARDASEIAERVASWSSSRAAAGAEEMALLNANPKLGRREGATLIVLHNGVEVARHTNLDTGSPEGEFADTWTFIAPLRLVNPVSGKAEMYAQIEITHYEGYNAGVPVGPDKMFDLNTPGVASPDGRTIAAGDSEVDPLADEAVLTVHDWTGKAKPVAFTLSCKPLAWQGNERFTALCTDFEKDASLDVEATVSLEKGQWTLRETRIVARHPDEGTEQSGTQASTATGTLKVYRAVPVVEE